MTITEPPWQQNGLPPMINIMWVASAKYWGMRRASREPDFMGSWLIISHMW